MGKFQTLDLRVMANRNGTYSTIHGRVDVVGEWRSKPKGRRLFSDDQIRAIRASDESQRELANRFDCSHVLIYHIKNRSVYRDVY